MSFNIGLSGLNAAQKQLDVTGNNIANVNTTGFKSSRAEFEDVYSATKLGVSSKTIGNGVRLANVSQNFGNGGMNVTGNALDMGIQGNGFFTLSTNGSLSYTRAGTFKTDKDGYVTNSDGTARLQGFAADSKGNIIPGVLTDLRIDVSNLQPAATDHHQRWCDDQPELHLCGDQSGNHSVRSIEHGQLHHAIQLGYLRYPGQQALAGPVSGQDRWQHLERLYLD